MLLLLHVVFERRTLTEIATNGNKTLLAEYEAEAELNNRQHKSSKHAQNTKYHNVVTETEITGHCRACSGRKICIICINKSCMCFLVYASWSQTLKLYVSPLTGFKDFYWSNAHYNYM